ncbi:hypothetical protein [Desulfogranum japonicum]|uniref:hypothetical protein n=1 Tax=Desulfogranum japonicum TaxID=231447 RepID=UPI001294759E|nr:hypothetical protein [Desulfogranum japonicum]
MSAQETVPYRPLGIIVSMLENSGFQMTHCYDDLVFIEHNAFLLQMGGKGRNVQVWFNTESEPDKRESIFDTLHQQGKQCGLKLVHQGEYALVPNEEEETLQLQFM